jgi:hypothetical protein
MTHAMRLMFCLLLAFFPVLLSANDSAPGDSTGNGDITPAVASALRSGNASALAAYFNSTVDLTLPGSEGTYSRSQAELIVKGFFNMNKPSDFTIQHKGSSGEGSQFCIGLLSTDNGDFRTYFLIKTISQQSVVTQLQFEEI